MSLSMAERVIIVNQMRILETLYPDEAKSIAYNRQAIESGYPLHYDDVASDLGVHEEALSFDQCIEVLDILSMFRALHFSMEKLADKAGIENWLVRFEGFDGNNEAGQLAYAEWFCLTGSRFEELHRPEGFNSHSPVLDAYRRMLEEWNRSQEKHALSRDDILRIGNAKIHPSNR